VGVYQKAMNYYIIPLSSTDIIGDSLSSVNYDYSKLEEWVSVIKLSSENLWEPFSEFYKNYFVDLKPLISNANQNLPKWKDMSTLIEENSSKWIEPLNVVYPNIVAYEDFTTTIPSYINTFSIWLNKNFPVKTITESRYLEYHEAIVSVYTNTTVNYSDSYDVLDSTTCVTSDTIASTPCKITYWGSTWCNGDKFNCSGSTSCTISTKVNCTFPESANKKSIRRIKSTLNYKFADTQESVIIRLKFKISDCKWNFITII
jgi:hypothetical protein